MSLEKLVFKYRMVLQALAAFFTNPHIPNYLSGKLYTGPLKKACVPGLNCYSCPAATGACPIGSFQAVVGSSKFKFSYYITGILILIGVLMGRIVCGFLCPFGWFQDLIHKIPVPKISTKKLRFLTYLKYVILVVVVWLLGVFIVDETGLSLPYFCKYICPQGILEGALPLSSVNAGVRGALGKLFMYKSITLVVVVITSSIIYRPFCKWICPLGAFYSLFNRMSIFQFHVSDKCIHCKKCERVCKMDVAIYKNQCDVECIRCGDCLKVCPTGAITTSIAGKTMNSKENDGPRIKA